MLEATNPSRANVIVSPANGRDDSGRQHPVDAPSATDESAVRAGPARCRRPDTADGGCDPTACRGRTTRTCRAVPRRPASTTAIAVRRTKAVFVGDVRIQPQAISVRMASTATLTRTSLSVEQRLSYNVLHEPVETLTLHDAGVVGRAMRDWAPVCSSATSR